VQPVQLMSNHARGKKEGAAADLGPGPPLSEKPGARSPGLTQLKVPGSVAWARSTGDMAARRSTAAISSPNPAATRRP
jgi:predicted secreted Zn-dependent protease